MFGFWVIATLWHTSYTLSYISRTTRYNLTYQLQRSGVWRPPGGGLQQLFSPNSYHYFKLDLMIHPQDFCKMEGNWNEFLLKVNSDFSGSRQWLKFRHQLLQNLQKPKENRFLGDICSDAADRPTTLHPAVGKLQICTLDVTWLLQNGQFIPAFKSLTGQGLRRDYLAAAGSSRGNQKLPSACERAAPFSILTKRTWAAHTNLRFHLPCSFISRAESSLTSCVFSLMHCQQDASLAKNASILY